MICDNAPIKHLKFCGKLRDQSEDIDREDFAQHFDADFILMTDELAALVQNLVEGFDGEVRHQAPLSFLPGRKEKSNSAAGAGCRSDLQIATQIRGWPGHLQIKFVVT